MNVTLSPLMSSTLANFVKISERMGSEMEKSRKVMYNDLNVSPVTLSPELSRVSRLLTLASLAVIGSVGNIFMISAVMVEEQLKKRGNAFLVNMALADLLVSGLVIPASAVVILSGQKEEDSMGVCRFEWMLEVLCFFVSVLTVAAVAIENYMRLCLPEERYAVLTSGRITSAILTIWLVAGITVAIQSSLDVGIDFCTRRFTATFPRTEEAVGASILIILPIVVTIFISIRLVMSVRKKMRGSYKHSIAYAWDYELAKANMASFVFFVLFWLPLGIVISYSTISMTPFRPKVFVYLAWFALSKSCFNNLLYCIANRHFRTAYVKLFHYCCCKTTVSFSRRQRGGDGGRSSGDVRLRVHIIHSYASPASGRPTNSRPNGREVYEL